MGKKGQIWAISGPVHTVVQEVHISYPLYCHILEHICRNAGFVLILTGFHTSLFVLLFISLTFLHLCTSISNVFKITGGESIVAMLLFSN